jgi:hypothetical protein
MHLAKKKVERETYFGKQKTNHGALKVGNSLKMVLNDFYVSEFLQKVFFTNWLSFTN